MHIFIIHGSFGNPDENWIPWLKKQLINLGHKVTVPKFPVEDYDEFSKKVEKDASCKANNQNLENWLRVFSKYEDKADEDSIFIGHSLGVAFILRLLEKIDKPVKAAILVSGFLGRLGNPVFDSVNSTFIDEKFNWGKIRINCPEFYVFASDNDPYVPFSETEKLKGNINNYYTMEGKLLANYLNVEFNLIKGGGHINASAGFIKFLPVLNTVNKIVLRGSNAVLNF